MAIEMGKKYRTRDGVSVRILCVDRPDNNPVVGLVGHEIMAWRMDGEKWADSISSYDLIEISPYSDIAIDAKGWARLKDCAWHPRHFAGVDAGGRPTTWRDGGTSHTTQIKASWDEFTTTKPEGVA